MARIYITEHTTDESVTSTIFITDDRQSIHYRQVNYRDVPFTISYPYIALYTTNRSATKICSLKVIVHIAVCTTNGLVIVLVLTLIVPSQLQEPRAVPSGDSAT